MPRTTMWAIAALVGALAAGSARAQQDTARAGPAQPGPARVQEEREERLRAEVMRRFLEHASRELDLTEEQRRELAAELQGMHERRRALFREQREVRWQLDELARSVRGEDAEAQQLLRRTAELKGREAELWRDEQERIGRILKPHQQVRFLMMQERFAERVRALRQRRGLDRPAPPGRPRARPEGRDRRERPERPQRPPPRRSRP